MTCWRKEGNTLENLVLVDIIIEKAEVEEIDRNEVYGFECSTCI